MYPMSVVCMDGCGSILQLSPSVYRISVITFILNSRNHVVSVIVRTIKVNESP